MNGNTQRKQEVYNGLLVNEDGNFFHKNIKKPILMTSMHKKLSRTSMWLDTMKKITIAAAIYMEL